MKYNKEDIKYFINMESIYTPKQTIRIFLLGILLFGLPTAVFGLQSNLPKFIMISIIIILSIWSMFLLRNPMGDLNQFNLYYGTITEFFSMVLLILGYGELSRTTQLSHIKIYIILALYLLCIAANLLITVKLIKKGHYRVPKHVKNYKYLVSIIGVTGILSGRKIFVNVNQDTASYVMGNFFIVAGLLFSSLGTTVFLRYYLGKKVSI